MVWNSEDVSVGAWLGPVRVNRVHTNRFDTEAKSRGCQNSYLITHKQVTKLKSKNIILSKYFCLNLCLIFVQTEDDMREKWHFLSKTGDICYEEVQITPGYNYNWSVPPSQCCVPDKDIP